MGYFVVFCDEFKAKDGEYSLKDLLSELFSEDEIPCVCAYCEHCVKIELTESFICKRGTLKYVSDTDSCKRFRPDLLKLEPKPRKKYRPNEDITF